MKKVMEEVKEKEEKVTVKKETKKGVKKDSKKKVKKDAKKESLFKQIKKEMQKVHFPNRKDMIKYSIATIAFVIFFALYFYVIEIVMAFVKSLI